MQNGIVQYHDPRLGQRAPVDFGMLPIIPEMVQRYITPLGRDFDRAKSPEGRQ
jgi:hypothetical protein